MSKLLFKNAVINVINQILTTWELKDISKILLQYFFSFNIEVLPR